MSRKPIVRANVQVSLYLDIITKDGDLIYTIRPQIQSPVQKGIEEELDTIVQITSEVSISKIVQRKGYEAASTSIGSKVFQGKRKSEDVDPDVIVIETVTNKKPKTQKSLLKKAMGKSCGMKRRVEKCKVYTVIN